MRIDTGTNRQYSGPTERESVVATKIRILRAFGFVLLAASLSGCERPTRISVKGGTSPLFVFSGSGKLENFAVFGQEEIQKAESPFDDSFALWEIKPTAGDSHGTPVRALRSITYGVVPQGYVQVKPEHGSPVPLAEGQKYFYEVVTTGAPWASGYLEIKNSRAVPTEGPGMCFSREKGKWIRVPCPQ